MAKLFLLRHLKSQWNLDDRFAGWVDNPLSKEGADTAKAIAETIKGQNFDVVYTSPLIRNMQTVIKILRNIGEKYPLFIHLDGGKMQKWGNFTDISENDLASIPRLLLKQAAYLYHNPMHQFSFLLYLL